MACFLCEKRLVLLICVLNETMTQSIAVPASRRPRFIPVVLCRRSLPVRPPTLFSPQSLRVKSYTCRSEWENVTRVVFSFKTLLSFATISIVLDYLA